MTQKRAPAGASELAPELREAAAHCGILIGTFHKLQKIGIFPVADLTTEQLEEILAELFAKGLPWPSPTRKSQWRPFPYSQPIWREIKGGPPRLHVGWRHDSDAKAIPHPFGSAAWTRSWFACEREYATQHSLSRTEQTDSPPLQTEASPPNPRRRARRKPPTPAQHIASDGQDSCPPGPARRGLGDSPSLLLHQYSRRRAAITQAEIARIIRAAKQAGATNIELRLNDSSTVIVNLDPQNALAETEEIVL